MNMDKRIGNVKQACSIYDLESKDPKGMGQELLLLNNGVLTLLVNLSHCGDIHQLWHKGNNVSFLTKNGLVGEHSDFLKSFPAGMVYTCGLDAIGGVPGHYLHGNIHNTPAEVLSKEETETGIKLLLRIEDTALFGDKLVLYRSLVLEAGDPAFHLEDRLVNEGFKDAKYCLLYHCNFGYPFLDERSEISGDILASEPRTLFAKQEAEKSLHMEAPVDDIEETCYFVKTGNGSMSITSPNLGLQATVTSSLKDFVEWKSRASGDYVVGLEPCTSHLDDHLAYRTIGAQKEETHTLEIRFKQI